MTYECIKFRDRRRKQIASDLEAWLKCADQRYSRFYDRLDDSPFDYHEVAGVGFLASAAALAGYLPLNEYDVIKRGKSDKRTKVRGRADLWFDAGKRCYSFEFKRTKRPETVHYLNQRLGTAFDDVKCVGNDEHDYSAACLVTVPRENKRIAICETFAEEEYVDFAYRIGPAELQAYLFFQFKD